MLTAYVDDSGTHGACKIVLAAGILGIEGRLDCLERTWRKCLEYPLDATKPLLRRFHMAECQASTGDFTGWSRTETDYFCHQLQPEIIDSGVAAYGVACSRGDWDELVTGQSRAILGDPEGQCIRNCFVRMIGWAQGNTFDPEMSFVFDSRPVESQRDARVVFDAFQEWVVKPKLVGISFLSSYDIVLLQVADMIAWELYQHANSVLAGGLNAPRRPQFQRLTSEMDFYAQIVNRASIERIIEHQKTRDPTMLKAMADHFTLFDPDAPDYSYLSWEQPW